MSHSLLYQVTRDDCVSFSRVLVSEGSRSLYIIASGGDDNALRVAILAATETSEDEAPSLVLHSTTTVPAAHSAQITGTGLRPACRKTTQLLHLSYDVLQM